MSRFFKSCFTILTGAGLIVWLVSPFLTVLSIKPAQAASATVTLYGCGSNPCYWIPPMGQVVPASSGRLALFSFNLAKATGQTTTLTNVKVNLVDPNGASATTAAADIARLSVYKRTSWDSSGGMMYDFPLDDRIGTITSIAAFSDGLSANNTILITQDGTANAIAVDQWSAEYYVTVETSASWSGTGDQDDQITYTMSVDWVTVSDGTLGSAFTGQPTGDNYYAAAPDGWIGNQFSVNMVDYMGTDGSGNHEVEVRFTDDVDQTTGETVTNYTVSATNPTSASRITPMSIRLVFPISVTITPNQTQIIVGQNIADMMGSTLGSDVTMTIMGGGGGGAAPVLISEIMIGNGASGLNEFVELYNPNPSSPINLANMSVYVWVATSSGSGVTHTKIANLTSGTIAANGYYLVASSQYTGISPAADATYDATTVHATEGALKPNSGVYISTSTSQNMAVMDSVGWGTATGEMCDGMPKCSSSDPESCTVANDGKSLERKANPSATAASMQSGADITNGNSYLSYDNQYDFIQRTTADPQSAASTAETPGGAGYGASNNYPFINHGPLFSAIASQDLIAVAEFMDDSGQLPASNVKLYYRFHDNDGAGAGTTPEATWNPLSGTQTLSGSNSYRFLIPSATLDAAKDLDYFLRAYDGTNYTCLPPGTSGINATCDASTNLIPAAITPFYVNVSDTVGSGVVSGTVQTSAGVGIPNVFVFAESMPFTATTNTSGVFTLTGLPDGVYDIRAQGGSYTVSGTTANYIDGWLSGIYINSNNQSSSGNVITLVQGAVEQLTGTAADQENPWVMWSAPNDMMMGFPLDQSLYVVFDRAMQRTTVTGGTATTDNVYLMNSSGSVAAGTVKYCPDATCYVAGIESGSRPAGAPTATNDPYLMIYDPTSNLSNAQQYTLVIKDTVLGSNGNRLMGNRPAGGHNVSFNTIFDTTGGTYGTGSSFPPYVTATTPGSGGFNAPLNTKINLSFNEAMSVSSINSTNIKIYTVSNLYSSNETETAFNAYTVSQNTAGNIAVLTPTTSLSASTHYRVKVLGNCTSARGIPMTNAGDASTAEMFRVDFETGTATDTTAPTIAGTYPNNADTNIPNNLPSIDAGFSEAMDAATINTNTIKLKRGTTVVSASVDYDIGERAAHILPVNALAPGASYTIYVVSGASGIKDVAGNALASNYEASFTTDSTADSTAPNLEFAMCDDFSCAVTFSEPMINARADDATNYAASVLKPANYALVRNPSTDNAIISAANANFEYDQMNNTVRFVGIAGLASGDQFRITVTNVKDKAGNAINTAGGANVFNGPVQSSAATGGMMGPGGPGPMMGPPTIGGSGSTMGGGMGYDFAGQWEKPTNVMPMNMMAGVTTTYFVQFEASQAIPAGGTIKLTFPAGTDIALAQRVSETYSMSNKDLNGMATGTVKIGATEATQSGGADDDGVAVNATARTVTITIDAANDGVNVSDFLMFDLKGIKNPTVPKSFDTNGYTVDIKTFNASGVMLESLTSFPYFINASGAYTLTGTITAASATGGTANVYLNSWLTGPMENTVTFSGITATYQFTSLPEGDYHLHTEPSITLNVTGGTADYIGYMKPDPIYVSTNNTALCSSTTCTKNFSFTKQDTSSAYQLAVQIVGDFSAMSATDRNIDIFAGGPNGNTVKTVSLAQQNYTTGSPYSANLYFPSAGEWWVGMGPAMPKGTMMMGPPPMPAWMPPGNIQIAVSGTYGSPSWTESSVTANDGTIRFTVSVATNQIIGYVIDGSGNAIANVDVEAHRTQGGFGMPSHATTDTSGKFTLKVTTGTYEINAWMPGLPWSPGRVIDVRDNGTVTGGAADGNTTADVLKDNGTTLVVDTVNGYDSSSPEVELLVKLNKSSTTISGKLLDDAGGAVAYAPVWAHNSSTGEHMPSGTDSSGNYTIYVANGTWYVEAFIPGIGDVSYANNPVAISGSSRSDINIRPATSANLVAISGRVYLDSNNNGSYDAGTDTAVDNASVWVDRGMYHNNTNTNSTGEYRLRVPANTGYSLKCWTPAYGELDPVNSLDVSSAVSRDFVISASASKTLTINFTNYSNLETNTEAFVDIFDPTVHKGNHKRIEDLSLTSSTTMIVKTGSSYEIHLFIPGLGELEATCQTVSGAACTDNIGMPDTWDISDDAVITFVVPDLSSLYTFTVTVVASGAATSTASDAFVWLGNESSGFHTGKPTNSSGVAVLKVPDGTYKLGVDKPGYTCPAPASVVPSTDSDCSSNVCTKSLTLIENPYTLSGTICADANSNGLCDTGEGLRAWVWADKMASTTNFSFAGGWTGAESDSDGSYELSISDGAWLIKAVADGYNETVYTVGGVKTALAVSGASQTGKNIALVVRSGYSAVQPKSAPVTPASGGTIDDRTNTGVRLTIPPSAMGTGTSAGTVNIQDTYSVPSTGALTPLGGKGKNISATNSSGQAITSLSGSATIEINYSESDIPSGISESQLMLVYFDNTSNQWVEVSASQDSTNDSFSGVTTHLTTYAIAYPADTGAPTTPGTPATSATAANSISFSWTASTDSETSVSGYEITRSADNVTFSTIGSTDPWATGSFVSSVLNSSTSYTDATVASGTTYYYQVIAYDTAGNHSASSATLTATSSGGTSNRGQGGTPPPVETEPASEPETPSAPATSLSSQPDNTLIKASDSDKVYVVKSGQLLWITNASAFESAGYQWSDIQTVTPSEITNTTPVTLLKSAASPNVYAISGGLRRHIPSAEIFESYGYKWSDVVSVTEPDAQAYKEVYLLKLADDDKVYVLSQGLRRHIPSAEVFESYGYAWAEIVAVNSTEMSAYQEAELVKALGQLKVYQIKNGKRHYIASPAIFNAHGWKWEDIMEINETELNSYLEDAAITE